MAHGADAADLVEKRGDPVGQAGRPSSRATDLPDGRAGGVEIQPILLQGRTSGGVVRIRARMGAPAAMGIQDQMPQGGVGGPDRIRPLQERLDAEEDVLGGAGALHAFDVVHGALLPKGVAGMECKGNAGGGG